MTPTLSMNVLIWINYECTAYKHLYCFLNVSAVSLKVQLFSNQIFLCNLKQ
uniref:Uncharacterized protein n=1 Tax=Anguilla anguilla TaxID=7936 RepID=A0A0E9X2F1_ANGAN